MAKQLINLGAVPNDGTGDNLRIGGDKINDNFNEIYSAIGNGTTAIGTIKVQDQTSTELTLSAKGDVLRIFGGQGIDATLSGNDLQIAVDGTVLSATQVSTLENKSIALGDNTITGTTAEFNTALTDDDFATLTNSVTLENKSISFTNNTITGTLAELNTAITDATLVSTSGSESLTNKIISTSSNTITGTVFKVADESSTQTNIDFNDVLIITGGEGVNTTISGDTITISGEDATSSNKGVATFNTADFLVTSGDVTIKALGVSNAQLAGSIENGKLVNNSITFGADTLALGDTTATITNLNLDGTSSLSGTGTVDTTGSANKLRFNHAYANVAALESAIPAATYSGMFAYNTTTSNAYVADPGGWSEIVTENSSIGLLSNVDITSTAPTNGQVLVFNSGTGIFEPGDQAAAPSFTTQKYTGDGSTSVFTINSGRDVDDILVFINGICLVPTDDYTISGTDLSFTLAPTASGEIVIRYLG